jgi:hypothetical protein
MTTTPVPIDPRARRAYAFPVAALPAGAIVIGLAGEVLRVRSDGGADEILPGGHPRSGAASDPCNTRRPA